MTGITRWQLPVRQRRGGDTWPDVGTVTLTPGVRVRLRCDGSPYLADAFHVRSAARYNDGSLVTSVTLAPVDGIILARVL